MFGNLPAFPGKNVFVCYDFRNDSNCALHLTCGRGLGKNRNGSEKDDNPYGTEVFHGAFLIQCKLSSRSLAKLYKISYVKKILSTPNSIRYKPTCAIGAQPFCRSQRLLGPGDRNTHDTKNVDNCRGS